MDCNTGAQLGRQFNKDAMMMHGGLPMEPGMSEQDVLMNQGMMPGMMPQQMGGDWSQAFAQQQHQQQQQMAALRQQHEMEQAFRSQQQLRGPSAPMAQQGFQQGQPNYAMQPMASPMMQQVMGGMMTANMGMGMMMPRTQYQPSMQMQQSQVPQVQQPQVNLAPANQDSAWATELGQQQWGQDYSNVQNFNVAGEENTTAEEKQKQSDFYNFMDRVRNKEIIIDEEKGEVVQGPGPDVEVPEDTEHLRRWAAAEGLNMPASMMQQAPQPGMAAPSADATAETPYVQDPDLAENDAEDWAREYAEMTAKRERAMNSTDYPFEPNNTYLYHDHPLEEGQELLQLGNLAEAALAFEAVCQKDTENVRAWYLLGTTQAENEKDSLAIIALNNARKRDVRDLNVHAALSVSHTNEHNTEAAMECLKAWLLNNPKYEQLGEIHFQPDPATDLEITDSFFFADPTRFREVSTLYHAAIEMDPNDATLYSNLGVLYNISHEFDIAAENFRAAVRLHPEDAKLWNRLGATLANGNHSEQALEAYNHALDINPGFVRAMYNMAVAYSNLGRYPLAAKQIVRALAVQQGDRKPSGEGAAAMATTGMWDLLRSTLSLMDRQDLVEMSHAQDLTPFIQEFNLQGLV